MEAGPVKVPEHGELEARLFVGRDQVRCGGCDHASTAPIAVAPDRGRAQRGSGPVRVVVAAIGPGRGWWRRAAAKGGYPVVDRERAATYAVRQGLTQPRGRGSLLDIVGRLCGIQDQVSGSAFYAALARSEAVEPGDLRTELQETRRLVRTWTIRGTMHVIRTEDLPLFRAALLPDWETRWSVFLDHYATRDQRRTAAEATLEVLRDGPATRAELLERVGRTLGGATPWLAALFSGYGGVLKDLSYQGLIIHGPTRGRVGRAGGAPAASAPGDGTPGDGPGRSGEVSFVRTEDWLGSEPPASRPVDADTALSVLLTRYLRAYGPASVQDFAYWSGVTVARTRRALELAGDQIGPADLGPPAGSIRPGSLLDIEPPGGPGGPGGPAPLAFLPKFDSYVLAHRDKFYLEETYRREVFRAAADVAATVVASGVVVGTWRWQGSGSSRSVAPSLFGTRSPELVRLVGEEGSRLGLAGGPVPARPSRT